ncbi:MAG: hypothetical protein U0359_07500 [Byssovorax sp.]
MRALVDVGQGHARLAARGDLRAQVGVVVLIDVDRQVGDVAARQLVLELLAGAAAGRGQIVTEPEVELTAPKASAMGAGAAA